MSSRDFLETLGAALTELVPPRERMDVLRYYKEYFEDAGPEREQEIIRELGDPRLLAEKIAREGGWIQEDAGEPAREKQKKPVWPIVLVASIAVVAVVTTVGGLLFAFNVFHALTGGPFLGYGAGNTTIVEVPNVDIAYGEHTVSGMELSEGFTAVKADIGLGNVSIMGGDMYEIYTDPGSGSDHDLQWSVGKNGVLEVTGAGSVGSLPNVSAAQVTIVVPWGVTLEKVDVEVDAGTVVLCGFSCRDVDASAGQGSVDVQDLSEVEELSLDSGMGDVSLSGELPRVAVMETGMGTVRVTAYCLERECDYELVSGMGEVLIDGGRCGQKASKSRGGSYFLSAETGMGTIEVDFWV